MSILDCFGQTQAVACLQQARHSGRVPHSYIFQGPEGVGKSLLARQWAKLLLCSQPQTKSWPQSTKVTEENTPLKDIDDCCDRCPDCHLVDTAAHPDLHIITKELIKYAKQGRDRKMIDLPKEIIREFVIEPAGLYPGRGRARVFIIEQVEDMNRAAQNALLKTLEEPPANTFLLLITSKPDRLLPTVRSRCQSVRFHPLPESFVFDYLRKAGIDPAQAAYWAGFSAGRLGPALVMAQMDIYEIKCELVDQIANLQNASALKLAGWLVEQVRNYAQIYLKNHSGHSQNIASRQGSQFFLEVLSYAFGLALRLSIEDGTIDTQKLDQLESIQMLVKKFGTIGCADAIRTTSRAEGLIAANVNPALIFDTIMLNYLNCAVN